MIELRYIKEDDGALRLEYRYSYGQQNSQRTIWFPVETLTEDEAINKEIEEELERKYKR